MRRHGGSRRGRAPDRGTWSSIVALMAPRTSASPKGAALRRPGRSRTRVGPSRRADRADVRRGPRPARGTRARLDARARRPARAVHVREPGEASRQLAAARAPRSYSSSPSSCFASHSAPSPAEGSSRGTPRPTANRRPHRSQPSSRLRRRATARGSRGTRAPQRTSACITRRRSGAAPRRAGRGPAPPSSSWSRSLRAIRSPAASPPASSNTGSRPTTRADPLGEVA